MADTGLTGAELREYRDRLGWSQTRLAEALGIHPQTLSKWEREAQVIEHPVMVRRLLDCLLRYGSTQN